MTDELARADGTDWKMPEFIRTGAGWSRPAWRQALLWLRWRPYFWLVGEIGHWRLRIADAREFGPFKRLTLIGMGDGTDELPGADGQPMGRFEKIIAVHAPDLECACPEPYGGQLHHIAWEPWSNYRFLGDRWHEKDERYFTWPHQPRDAADATAASEAQATTA